MSNGWTSPQDIADRVRRRWSDGSMLRSYAEGAGFEPIEIPLRGPRASEIGEDLSAARAWVAALDSGSNGGQRYSLTWGLVGGRVVGRNSVPTRAVVASFEQAWALLGTAAAVRRYDEVLAMAAAQPRVRSWAARHPHRALELAEAMPRLLSAYTWLDDQRGSGRYLREIGAPGVDTKFAERHRAVLAAILGVSTTPSGFLADLGLRAKPELVRLRVDAAPLGLPATLTELAVRADELARLAVAPASALVVENEVTYLSVPIPQSGVILWGKGFEVDRVGRLPWLTGVPVRYWGDIDTHGFAILDRLRAWLPQAESVLMDRATLLEHRDRWVVEERPATSVLTRLRSDEQGLYTELVSDRLGDRVRLEQELVHWPWALRRLEEGGCGCRQPDPPPEAAPPWDPHRRAGGAAGGGDG